MCWSDINELCARISLGNNILQKHSIEWVTCGSVIIQLHTEFSSFQSMLWMLNQSACKVCSHKLGPCVSSLWSRKCGDSQLHYLHYATWFASITKETESSWRGCQWSTGLWVIFTNVVRDHKQVLWTRNVCSKFQRLQRASTFWMDAVARRARWDVVCFCNFKMQRMNMHIFMERLNWYRLTYKLTIERCDLVSRRFEYTVLQDK